MRSWSNLSQTPAHITLDTPALSSVVENLQLPPYRVEFSDKLTFGLCSIGVGANGVEVDFGDHAVQELANLFESA